MTVRATNWSRPSSARTICKIIVMQETIYTIGHSTHSSERFIALLKQHRITALCDVRSQPYSRMNPQFNREVLKQQLWQLGIGYVFLGTELGARSADVSCYDHGKVQYDRLARTELFRQGLERVKEGVRDYRVALMCSEKDPLECHRTLLVSRQLEILGFTIQHILADGNLENQSEALSRLTDKLHMAEPDMFRSREEVLADAYRIQSDRIAYTLEETPRADATRSAAG
jgi:uncharacterized protein (DUF488 family)